MKATVEKQEKNRVSMTIEVEESRVDQAMSEAFHRLVKRVNVPGFRKGHVPRPVFERFVGKEALFQEALEALVPAVYEQAVADTNIQPIDQPSIDLDEYGENQPLKLKVEVDVKPEVVLHDYKGLAVERTIERVTDESVDHVLYHMRENQAELISADRNTVQQGDYVTLDFTGFVDGKAFPGGAAKDYVLEIGSGRFIPGFEDQLVGAAVGEDREVQVTFPEDYGNTALAGKAAVFQVKVHEIKERKLPALDDDFASTVSDFNTLAELRADIRGNLEKQAAERADNEMQTALVRKAAQNAEVEVPAVMIDREVDAMLNDLSRSLYYRGIDTDQYLRASGRTQEDLRQEFRSEAEDRVRGRLVLEAIAAREGITVPAAEIQQRIDELAARAGNQAETVKARYNEPARRKAVEEDLKVEKAVELLTSSAQVTTKEVDAPVEPGHEGHKLTEEDASSEKA